MAHNDTSALNASQHWAARHQNAWRIQYGSMGQIYFVRQGLYGKQSIIALPIKALFVYTEGACMG